MRRVQWGASGACSTGGCMGASILPWTAPRPPLVGDGEDPLVGELLDALAVVDLGGVDVAARVDRHVVHPVQLARVAPAPAEAREDLAAGAREHPHVGVL